MSNTSGAIRGEMMVKIIANHNKQDVMHLYSFGLGQAFPNVEGKLVSVEVSGKELSRLMEEKEIPVAAMSGAFLTWYGKQAGSVLKVLRELFG